MQYIIYFKFIYKWAVKTKGAGIIMKKRITMLLLAAMMAFGGVVTVHAEPETTTREGEELTPYYQDISSIIYSFRIYSDGEAYYVADVETSSSTKIKCYMELQYSGPDGWEKVKGTTITKYSSSAVFEGSEYVDEPGDYRVRYEITAYYGNGKSETTTKYKYDTY